MNGKQLINIFPNGFSNAYIILGEKPVMIDTGSERNPQDFVDFCSGLGIVPEDIELIAVSHEHADHYLSLDIIKELTGAPVLCHSAAKDFLVNGWPPSITPRTQVGADAIASLHEIGEIPKVVPDMVIEGEYDLGPYGIPGAIVHTPGHSAGSLSVILDTGDVILGDIFVQNEADGALVAALFADDVPALEESIKLLLAKGTSFYSGHGGPFSKDEIIAVLEKDVLKVF